MPEFFNVLPPDAARELLLRHVTAVSARETVATADALGRVTAVPIHAPHPLPTFRRSTMDGYAVRAADTYGASDGLPAYLQLIGELFMGQPAHLALQTGQAAIIHTGGMLPETADAVIPIEQTQLIHQLPATTLAAPFMAVEIELFRAVAPGQNVLQVGEDVGQGAEILPTDHRLRPQDLGGLLALGITEITVTRRPTVGILATGDEVVPPYEPAGPGQIRDINSYTIAGLVQQAGGIPRLGGILRDDFNTLQATAVQTLATHDMLVMTAGSSVSVRDMTAAVINSLGAPGILLHGVATRPGKPTIVGAVAGKPILGLPGNPVSAMIQFDMLGIPALYRLQGMAQPPRRAQVRAQLTQNIPSESGREDYIPARLHSGPDGLQATPVLGKSNLIYTLVHADGLLKIPLNKGGLLAGEWVEVQLF